MNTCLYFVNSCVKYYSLSPADQDFKHRQAEIDRKTDVCHLGTFLSSPVHLFEVSPAPHFSIIA